MHAMLLMKNLMVETVPTKEKGDCQVKELLKGGTRNKIVKERTET